MFALFDSGAIGVSCISDVMFKELATHSSVQLQSSEFVHIKGVGGQYSSVVGMCTLAVTLGPDTVMHTFQVVSMLGFPVIIGTDFMTKYKCVLDFEAGAVRCSGAVSGVQFCSGTASSDSVQHSVFLCVPATLPPWSRNVLPVLCDLSNCNNDVLLEPVYSNDSGIGAKCLATLVNGQCIYEILNPSAAEVKLEQGLKLAVCSEFVSVGCELGPVYDQVQAGNSNAAGSGSAVGQVGKDAALDTKIDNVSVATVQNVNSVFACDSYVGEAIDRMQGVEAEHEQKFLEAAAGLGVNLDSATLTADQKRQLLMLIGEYRDVFAKDLTEVVSTDKYFHYIDTGNAAPIRVQPYRTSPRMQDEIDKQVKVLLEADIVEESMSPWQAPVVMVKKPHVAPGESPWRLVIDYRKVNGVTQPMSFVMPRVDEACDAIGAAAGSNNDELFMTVLDMRSGYYSITLTDDSKAKTGFATQRGVYQFKRLAMGLVNAPMSYQMIIQDVLRNLHWRCALAYIDDLLVYSLGFTRHLSDLRQVFERIRKAKLRIHPKKGQFAAREVKYVGHVLSRQGVRIDPGKAAAIAQMSTPKSVHDVRVFLGCTNFFRKYICKYSLLAMPLTCLLKSDVDFLWSPECEQSFQELKAALLSAPILCYPDFNKEFVLTCDASNTAIGYWLGQTDERGLHAIAFGGRKLAPRETRYNVSERECLALVEGIKHYRMYLATNRFKVITDHFSLQYLRSIKDMNGRLGHWSLFLQGYDFYIEYKAGKLNGVADFLSRIDYPIHANDNANTDSVECELFYAEAECNVPSIAAVNRPTAVASYVRSGPTDASNDGNNAVLTVDNNDIQTMQRLDHDLRQLCVYIDCGELPADAERARKVVIEVADYVIDCGVLYHLYYPRGKGTMLDRQVKQLVIPAAMQADVLRSFHDSPMAAHQGADRMYAAMRQRYFWKTMYKDTQMHARSCLKCQEMNPDLHKTKAPLKPLPIGQPWSRIHVDITGPFTQSEPEGYLYLLVVTCSFSKWVEAFCLRTQTAAEVAWLLYAEIICRYGAPRSILSDRGAAFMSELVTELCRLFHITKTQTSSYHPECNSAAERTIGSIVTSLRKYCRPDQKDWPKYVPGILCAYRTTPATESTTLTPHFTLFGRECRLPLDQALLPNALGRSAQAHVEDICRSLEVGQAVARENIERAQAKYSAQYNKKTIEPVYKVGDKVLVKVKQAPAGVRSKLYKKFTGPFYICLVHGNYTYTLRKCSDNTLLTVPVHANRLKMFVDRVSDAELQGDIYFVERIICCKKVKGRQLYLIKWRGYKQKTWEPLDNLPEWLVREFHVIRTLDGTVRKRGLRV